MQTPERVTITECLYDPKTDAIKIEITRKDGSEATLAWTKKDFAENLKIYSDIPVAMMMDFCHRIKGKEINLIIGDEE